MSAEFRHLHLRGALGAPRTELWDGREHLVVPVVALQEAAIHAINAPTREFVPGTVLTASADKWNGHPLVVGHPVRDGKQVSAHDPDILVAHGFGFIRNGAMKGNRLGIEAFVDPARLEALGQDQLLADLRAGKPIEVSVGAFVQTNENRGTFAGRDYSGEWATIMPDHLAFLPGGVGACSLAMGCGANRVAEANAGTYLVTAEGFEALGALPDKSQCATCDGTGKIKEGKVTCPDCKGKLKGASMHRTLKERVKAFLKTLDGTTDDPDEQIEDVSYAAMDELVTQAESSLAAGREHVDALVNGNGAGDNDDMEDAHLEALVAMCVQLYGTVNGLMSLATKQLAPDLPEPGDSRYMEQFKTLIGKAISAKNMKTIQAAHDAAHDMHDHTVALGADCKGIHVLSADKSATTKEHEMTTTERQVALKTLSAIPDASFTACDLKGLNLLSDKGIAELVTLAGKSPADAIIQAKANADAALAGHAHGLNAQDAADAAKKAAADKAKADADAADAEPEEKEKKMKAAADRDEAERAAFFAKNPELKTLIDRQRSQEVARKAKLVAALKGGPLTDKQLEVKPLDELETLAAYAGAAVEEPLDYSGRGMPRAAADGADVYATPPNGYDLAIEKMRKAAH